MTKITINVTEEHIVRGFPHLDDTHNCPVALALRDRFSCDVRVGVHFGHFIVEDEIEVDDAVIRY